MAMKMEMVMIKGTVEARQWTLGRDGQEVVDVWPWDEKLSGFMHVINVAATQYDIC